MLTIAKAQLTTFKGYSWRVVLQDCATFLGLPLLLGTLSGAFAPPVYNLVGLLTGASIFAGLLAALLVNVFNFSVKLRRDEGMRPEQRVVRTTNELMANTAWTVITALAVVIVLASTVAIQPPQEPVSAVLVGIITALATHLVLNVLMVLSRIWSAHEDIKDLPPKRTTSI